MFGKRKPFWRCIGKKHRHPTAVAAIECCVKSGHWHTVAILGPNGYIKCEHPVVTFWAPKDQPLIEPDPQQFEDAYALSRRLDLAFVAQARYLLDIGVRGGARFG